VERVADIVSRYVSLDLPLPGDRHAVIGDGARRSRFSRQVLEAGVNQSHAWGDGNAVERENIFVGVARNLAAHCPTRRAGQQTAIIAERLHRGEKMFEA
jgi:hypothetical protein